MKNHAVKIFLIASLMPSIFLPSFTAIGSSRMSLSTLGYQCTNFVSTDGSDNNPGSQSQPWRTIQHAADQSNPGDIICVQAGSYEERIVIANSGTSRAPIVFQGVRSAKGEWLTIIDGSKPVPKGIWQSAPEIGFGVWKTTSFSYDPHNMIVLDQSEPDVNRQWKQISL